MKQGDRIQWTFGEDEPEMFRNKTFSANIAIINEKEQTYGVYTEYGQDFIPFDQATMVMTLEKAIEVLKVHQNWRLGEDTELLKESVLAEAIGVVLGELERVTTRLGESLPNGGFCVKNCKNSMKPTLKHDTE